MSAILPTEEPNLQASSPDEISLVRFTYGLGVKLRERERTHCSLTNSAGVTENYRILALFPFTSESKKMSVLLR